ncbi:MAG: GNAT family N-acetyltransferase [Cyanobacteria bacterium P01_H01_bin.121]
MLDATNLSDLPVILALERSPDNAPFIRQWPEAKHEAAIADPNIAHLKVVVANQIVGYTILVGLQNFDQSLELKRLVIALKGQGLGRQTIQEIQAMAFQDHGMHRLWLEVLCDHAVAYSLYTSMGFQVEGVHREALRQSVNSSPNAGDRYLDLTVMSMLRHEYEALPG